MYQFKDPTEKLKKKNDQRPPGEKPIETLKSGQFQVLIQKNDSFNNPN